MLRTVLQPYPHARGMSCFTQGTLRNQAFNYVAKQNVLNKNSYQKQNICN